MYVKNLSDLVHKLENDPSIPVSRTNMTLTACNYVRIALRVDSLEEIPLHQIYPAQRALEKYLKNCDKKYSMKRNNKSFYRRLITYGQDNHYLPKHIDNDMFPEWEGIAKPIEGLRPGERSRRYSLRKLGRYATTYARRPKDITTDFLKDFMNYLRNESGIQDWRQIYTWARKEWMNLVIQGVLPKISWPKLPTGQKAPYALPLDKWPEKIQKQYWELYEWQTAEFVPSREAKYKNRPISAKKLLSDLQCIAGYAHNILEIPIEEITFDIFFNERIITSYLNWFIKERTGKKTVTLTRKVVCLLGLARGYFKREDAVQWLLKLKHEAGKDVVIRDKSSLLWSIKELYEIPEYVKNRRLTIIRNAKKKNRKYSPRKIAQLFRDELILRLLIARPFRQRNIREMRLEKNLFRNSEGQWWIKFEGKETKSGNTLTYSFPKELVKMLEEYLYKYRPIILGEHKTNLAFPSPSGRPVCSGTIQRLVSRNGYKARGKHIYPHLLRDCVGYWWMVNNPGQLPVISEILGHRRHETTLRIYTHFSGKEACKIFDEFRYKAFPYLESN